MRRLPIIVSVFSGLAVAGSAATLIYLWIELGHRGEVADAIPGGRVFWRGEKVVEGKDVGLGFYEPIAPLTWFSRGEGRRPSAGGVVGGLGWHCEEI